MSLDQEDQIRPTSAKYFSTYGSTRVESSTSSSPPSVARKTAFGRAPAMMRSQAAALASAVGTAALSPAAWRSPAAVGPRCSSASIAASAPTPRTTRRRRRDQRSAAASDEASQQRPAQIRVDAQPVERGGAVEQALDEGQVLVGGRHRHERL